MLGRNLNKEIINSLEWIPKGWGGEKIIVNNDLYCGKILYLMKSKRCSIHYHQIKDETFYIQRGKISLYYSDDINKVKELLETKNLYQDIYHYLDHVILTEGDSFHIPVNRAHQMIALQDTELFEFSTQDFPNDSHRLLKGD